MSDEQAQTDENTVGTEQTQASVNVVNAKEPQKDENTRQGKLIIGRVSSDKMDKTIVVDNVYLVKHSKINKYIRRRSRYYAHDENNEAQIGDKVEIEEQRPLSQKKRWTLIRKLEH